MDRWTFIFVLMLSVGVLGTSFTAQSNEGTETSVSTHWPALTKPMPVTP